MVRPLGSQGCGCPRHRGPREAPPGRPRAVRAACCASDCPKSLWVLWEQGQSRSPGWAQSPNCRVNAGHQDTCSVRGPLLSGCVLPKRPWGSVRRLSFQPPETAMDASGGLLDPSVPPLGDFLLFLLRGAGEAGLPLGPCNPGHRVSLRSTCRAGKGHLPCGTQEGQQVGWGEDPTLGGRAEAAVGTVLAAVRPLTAQCPPLPCSSRQMGFLGLGGLRAVSPPLPHRWTSGSAHSHSPSQQDPHHFPRGASVPSALASRSG